MQSERELSRLRISFIDYTGIYTIIKYLMHMYCICLYELFRKHNF